MQLKSTRRLCAIISRFTPARVTVQSILLQTGLIASLFVLFGQSRASIILNSVKINAIMTRKNSNCVGILYKQVEAATASNLHHYPYY